MDDEPEAAVLLVACTIGLATGGGVVLFNDVIHAIRHYAWQVSFLQLHVAHLASWSAGGAALLLLHALLLLLPPNAAPTTEGYFIVL